MRAILSALAALLLLCATPAQATRWVEAEGSAIVTNGAVNMAREQAIKNAIQQAMLQTAATVDSTSTITSNVLVIESSRVNAAGTVEDVQILDEWRDEDFLFVRIRAHVPNTKIRQPSPAARYRKKVAALQFEVLHRTQVHDLPNIEMEFPRELLRRMESTGNYIGIDGTQFRASSTAEGYRIDEPEVYTTLANNVGAQIVISGIIRDMGVKEGWFYDYRHLEVEIFVHDGISGARIARHRFSENVKKGEYFTKSMDALFSNARFMQTPYGRALNTVLNRQVEMVDQDLEKLPFSARVVEVDGNKIYFDAGGTSMVRVGDVLMTYRMEPDPLRGTQQHFLGYKETPIASLAVNQIQPQFSVGELETKEVTLLPGDIIRFGW